MKLKLLTAVSVAIFAVNGQTTYNPVATRTFGQAAIPAPGTSLTSGSPNLVEGREFYLPQSLAFDTSTSPPILYVADTFNHRVLAWKNASAAAKGATADLVIGQLSLSATKRNGPTTPQTTGLAFPTSVAVDSSGNVYVSDSGNNRIMRFPKPFSQSGYLTPDLLIGQSSYSSGMNANQGAAIPSAKTLYLSQSTSSYFANGMTLDSQGNLWVTDPGNNRVVRFPVAQLRAGTSQPAADLVLGQPGFATLTVTDPQNTWGRVNKAVLVQPIGIAFDGRGNLYVSDSRMRVMYFPAPISSGQNASRILGIPTPTATDLNPRAINGCPSAAPYPCESALGLDNGSGTAAPPRGLAVLNNQVFVADTDNHRIVKYDTPESWGAECVFTSTGPCASGQLISPAGVQFIGQPNGQSNKSNQLGQPTAATLASPVALAFLNSDMWVADAGNNRVLMLPGSSGFSQATRLLGQIDFGYSAPNLAEGKEMFVFDPYSAHVIGGLGTIVGGGVALDSTTATPHLYIADTFNNRVLGFRDARKVRPGQAPDLVIGQVDLFNTSANYATHDPAAPTDSTLSNPVGLLIDSVGDLYVADAGNGRVLRFSRPFEQSGTIRANLVLGQRDLFSRIIDPTPANMRAPWGMAFSNSGHLLVTDWVLNRVLIFQKPTGGDFVNGQAASSVIGQPDFFSSATGTTSNRFNAPRGIATDSSDRIYVADNGNSRISIFSGVINGGTDPAARITPQITQPVAIAVNRDTGEVWVTDLGGSRLVRFPIYETWALSVGPNSPGGQPIDQLVTTRTQDNSYPSFPVALTLDTIGNPIVLESNNQVAFHFLKAQFRNLFSYAQRGLTPGMLAYLFRLQGPAIAPNLQTQSAAPPLPRTLADMQVLFMGNPAPIYQVTSTYVVFQVPWGAPTSGFAEVQLITASTQQVLTSAVFEMHVADPGLATANASGSGQLAVTNADGSVNSPVNGAARGSIVSFYGTGIGPLAGAPADGQNASGAVGSSELPSVSMNPGGLIPGANVLYFGLVNWFPGVFQLNVKIPDTVPPSPTVQVGIVFRDFFSTEGPPDANGNGTRLVTTIGVK